MNRRGSHNGNARFDEKESSGVTRLAPVPVKTMRLSGLDDNDRTQFFSAGVLVERGKVVAAREQERAALEQARAAAAAAAMAAAARPPTPDHQSEPSKPGLVQQLRQASFARKATILLLPILLVLLLLKPVFKKPMQVAATAPGASAQALAIASLPVNPPAANAPAAAAVALAATPPEPPPTLPRGVSLEKAAVDAVEAGDFGRALALYRELARREPQRAAYADAVKILERRVRAQAP